MSGPWEDYKAQEKKGDNRPPWEDYKAAAIETKNSAPESLLKGLAQGATLGFADEIRGVAKAGFNAIKNPSEVKGLTSLVDSYKKYRDEARVDYEQARKDHPGFYMGGEITGSLGTSFMPGLSLVKGASAAQNVQTAARGAAIMGAGTSNADLTKGETMQLAQDMTKGAAIGMGAQFGIQGAGIVGSKILQSITPSNLAKKSANVLLNTPEEITDTYLKNPQGVLKAPLRFELANSIEEKGITPLQKMVNEGSQESRKILDSEGTKIPGSEISKLAKNIADDLEERLQGLSDDPQRLAAIKWLRNIQNQYAPKIQKSDYFPSLVQQHPKVIEDKLVSTNRLKDSIQSIYRNVEWEIRPGKYGKIDENTKKELRSAFDGLLKGKSPAYEEQMKQVASDANLLKDVNEVAASKRGWANVFRRLETDKYGSGQLPSETLKRLDTRLDTNFVEQSKLSNAREAFDKSITNGSRNVNLFSNFLRPIPIIGKIAPLIGGTVDKYGRELTMKAVNFAIKINDVYEKEGVQSFMRIAKPIYEAAKLGNISAVITLQLLEKGNPKAMQVLEQQQAMNRRIEMPTIELPLKQKAR